MTNHLRKIFLLCALCALAGCQSLQNLADVQKPSLSIADVHVTDFSFNEIELTYDVKVDNPNPVTLQMLSYDYDFDVNGNDFIKGTQDKRLSIQSSGASTFEVPMRLNFQDLYNLFSGLKGKDEAGYKLALNLDFDLPVVGKTTLPIKKSGDVPMIKLPKINLAGIKVDDVNFSQADLTLNLNVNNPNGFGLLVNALSYDLNVNGKNWVTGNNSQNMSIGKNDQQTISIPVSLNIAQIGTSVFQLINNSNQLKYDLKGNFNFGADHPLFNAMQTDYSFDKNGLVPLDR